jgi:DNA-binding GntR family transcriptional regulator
MNAQLRSIRLQLGDVAAAYLRDQITSGNLPAGAPVRPETVADELGISTTPAREALQALRAEGFLDLAPRRGFTVAKLDGDDIRDMFLVQAMVAGELAARAAANVTPENVASLDSTHKKLVAAAEREDLTALEELNHQFHRDINLAANSPRLANVIRLVSRYAPRRFYATIAGWPETTVHDHTLVLDAIRRGDADTARRKMAAHVNHAAAQLASHIDARIAAQN